MAHCVEGIIQTGSNCGWRRFFAPLSGPYLRHVGVRDGRYDSFTVT